MPAKKKNTVVDTAEETSAKKRASKKPAVEKNEEENHEDMATSPAVATESENSIEGEKVSTENKKPLEADAEPHKKFVWFPGQVVRYHGVPFILLEEKQGGLLAISMEEIGRMKFNDNDGPGSNDWRKSSIRKKLNTEHIKKFDTNDLIPVISDLTADTGETDYGTSEDYIALPNDAIFRKHCHLIPSYETWIWSITPWAIKFSTMSAVSARTGTKTIYSEQPSRELGVAIVCIFKQEAIP